MPQSPATGKKAAPSRLKPKAFCCPAHRKIVTLPQDKKTPPDHPARKRTKKNNKPI